MDKYKNKYRIPSARAQWWDYAWDASYFITICTRNMKHFFGRVRNGKMELSPIGIIADACWHDLPNHAKNIALGEHVVMPNHIHGIITLSGNAAPIESQPPLVQTRPALSPPSTAAEDSPNKADLPKANLAKADLAKANLAKADLPEAKLPKADLPEAALSEEYLSSDFEDFSDLPQTPGQMRFRNPGKNTLSTILGGYKSAVSREAAKAGFDFAWHARFHDHIIRDVGEYQRITNYIQSNPSNWEKDKYYSGPTG
jgi:REP element-mobilizing transposase RayT